MSASLMITNRGIEAPQTSEIKEAFQDVYKKALGDSVNLDDASPQGQIIDDLTDIKQTDNSNLLYLMNQIDPLYSDGIFQNAIASLFFIERKAATPSIVTCECIGAVGTVLNGVDTGSPALAKSSNGDIFECLETVTIPNSGVVNVQFRSKENGAVPVLANTVNNIYVSVPGWDSVNNPATGTIGQEMENREDFEKRRKESLAINSTGSLSSVRSRILSINDVVAVYCDENTSGETITRLGVSLKPHSIYICVNGGTPAELGEAIYRSKSGGCDTNGDVACSYVDEDTRVTYTYYVKRPVEKSVYVRIILSTNIGEELENEIKEDIATQFQDITIADTVYASRFFAIVAKYRQDIVSIKVSSDGNNWSDFVEHNADELPVSGTISIITG